MRRATGQVIGQPAPDALYRWQLARAVVLPQAPEAAQLALEVARGLAEALQAGRAPVHGMDLCERVDELLAHAPALSLRVQRRGHLRGDDVALEQRHDVEGRADDLGVLAHREHLGHARAAGERPQHARLAKHVVRAGGQRATRGRRTTSWASRRVTA